MIIPNALGMSREYAGKCLNPGDRAVDATAGRGRDTLLLSELVGEVGTVWSFDIQEEAVAETGRLLEKEGHFENVILVNDGHENMDAYIDGDISCAMFNLGYLPGGDHSVHTKPETSITAVQKACGLLKNGGLVLIVVYQGGDTGFRERDEMLKFCGGLDQGRYTVSVTRFTNQRGNPPIFICIQKQ